LPLEESEIDLVVASEAAAAFAVQRQSASASTAKGVNVERDASNPSDCAEASVMDASPSVARGTDSHAWMRGRILSDEKGNGVHVSVEAAEDDWEEASPSNITSPGWSIGVVGDVDAAEGVEVSV